MRLHKKYLKSFKLVDPELEAVLLRAEKAEAANMVALNALKRAAKRDIDAITKKRERS